MNENTVKIINFIKNAVHLDEVHDWISMFS